MYGRQREPPPPLGGRSTARNPRSAYRNRKKNARLGSLSGFIFYARAHGATGGEGAQIILQYYYYTHTHARTAFRSTPVRDLCFLQVDDKKIKIQVTRALHPHPLSHCRCHRRRLMLMNKYALLIIIVMYKLYYICVYYVRVRMCVDNSNGKNDDVWHGNTCVAVGRVGGEDRGVAFTRVRHFLREKCSLTRRTDNIT